MPRGQTTIVVSARTFDQLSNKHATTWTSGRANAPPCPASSASSVSAASSGVSLSQRKVSSQVDQIPKGPHQSRRPRQSTAQPCGHQGISEAVADPLTSLLAQTYVTSPADRSPEPHGVSAMRHRQPHDHRDVAGRVLFPGFANKGERLARGGWNVRTPFLLLVFHTIFHPISYCISPTCETVMVCERLTARCRRRTIPSPRPHPGTSNRVCGS